MEIKAVYGICNTGSYNLYDIEYGIDDYAVVGLNDSKPRRYKILSCNKGEYIRMGNSRLYLADFIKI